MELTIRGGDAPVPEEEEADFPKASGGDRESVRPGPVLTIRKRDVEPRQGSGVHLNSVVGSCGCVVKDLDAHEVHTDRVAHDATLMVFGAENDFRRLRNVEPTRITRSPA